MSRTTGAIPQQSIPYYVIRAAIQEGYGRRRLLRDGKWFGVVCVSALGLALLQMQPSWLPTQVTNLVGLFTVFMSLLITVVVFVFVGFVVMLLWFTFFVTIDALDYGERESALVDRCIEVIRQQGYKDLEREAIRDMAVQGVNAVQVRALLPFALLTAIATVVAITNLPIWVGVGLGAVVVLILLAAVAIIGQAYADVVMQKALVELQRREKAGQDLYIQ